MITRTFHPIGQGAFYSERIGDKTIVYDCGVWNRKDDKLRAEKIVNAAFPNQQPIFILFISHFDFDHVSQIHLLVNSYKVDNIVMPLLDADEKLLITNYLAVNGLDEIAQLVSDPEGFANQYELAIYQVENGEPPNDPNDNIDRPTIDLDLPPTGLERDNHKVLQIKSGARIIAQKRVGLGWVWVPFNFKSISRAPELIKELQLAKIDITKLNDAHYVQSNLNAINSAYHSIEGNINQNSMFLYSGPEVNKQSKLMLEYIDPFYFTWRVRHQSPACVYTGDGDLNHVDISLVYKEYWENVGTVQIPHHGSKHDFNLTPFIGGRLFCPISFGDNNTYGHPAGGVLQYLLENKNYPILVTERASSIFMQNWH